jgi:hypothetical protein
MTPLEYEMYKRYAEGDNKPPSREPLSFFAWLTLLFLALYLTNVTNWSLWLVLLPWYGPPILGILFRAILKQIYKEDEIS